jgi:hypothetical protein
LASKDSHQIQENTYDIKEIKLIVLGDGNGRKGLVRRTDALEKSLGILLNIGKLIAGLVATLFGKMVYDIVSNILTGS